MAKKNRSMKPLPFSTPTPRLEGNELFAWAQLIAREEYLVQEKQQTAARFLTSRGLTPGEYLLTNDGYVLSRKQMESLVGQPPLPEGRSIPGSETSEPGGRTTEKAAD